ncbi:MAG: hypothetical protein IPP15_04475 [Saprospiraceae bacterium]|uniref:Uncharacterized protein n=1 Tax=Candidatus Opimibacter skivensis TaxID=2982028 RepID=A0A9D7XMY2_9BACT|nr:hypothetical protein [Candidatus Opimibacter skivensis]
MTPKYKTTGCFRFFVFFLIFVPAVYFGATFFRGENGWQMIKDFYHKIVGKSDSTSSGNEIKSDTYKVDDCQTALKKMQNENDELKRQLREKEDEISVLKKTGK